MQRSGWDRDARFLIFDCGPLGDGGHGHYDALSFEAHAHGRPLVLDPGRGSYSEAPPNLRRWFRGTAAHNTVASTGSTRRPTRAAARRADRARRACSARTRRRARRRGRAARSLRGGPPAPHHVRRRALLGDRGRLEGEREHRYDLRFHLARRRRAVDGTPCAPGAALAIHGADAIALEPGWIAPRYGEYLDAPVVSAVAHGTPRALRDGAGAGMTASRPTPPCPQRDALLDERCMASRLGAAPLRAHQREVPRRRQPARRLPRRRPSASLAGRTFPGEQRQRATAARPRGERARRRAPRSSELETVFWTFPNDRRLAGLRAARPPHRRARPRSSARPSPARG